MTCEFAFLAVGNADSIIVSPSDGGAVIVDVPKPREVSDFLSARGRLQIEGIYITHTHRDHFAPLNEFVSFLKLWFDLGGSVNNVFIASEAYHEALEELGKLEATSPKKHKLLQHALAQLLEWREGLIHFEAPTQRLTPSCQSGALTAYVLHPEQLFAAEQFVKSKGALNDRSVVIKLDYHGFIALLLADVERAGLRDLGKIYAERPQLLRANLVKIPHHGAWPTRGEELKSLLKSADAEIAVLSVGSKNRHRHVVPALFNLLNQLVADTSLRLKKFLCTEVTRTCLFSSVELARAGRAGLPERMPCGGDIIVTADDAGNWTLEGEREHAVIVSGIKYAACENRLDY